MEAKPSAAGQPPGGQASTEKPAAGREPGNLIIKQAPAATPGQAGVLKPGGALNAAAAAAPAPPEKRESDPQAAAIVENYLKVIGGRDVLTKVKDRVTSFRNIKYQSTGETVAEIGLFIKDGILIREEWDIKGFDIKGKPLAFVQIYNGAEEEAWVQMLGTVSPLEGKTLSVFVWEKYMDDFFCHWQQDGYTVNMAGNGLVEDEPCDIILVNDFSARQQLRYFFSKQSGLVLKKEWQDTGANAKTPIKREQYYKMYRDLPFLDGSGLSVKFPLRLEIYADGDLDTERVFTNVRFNSGLKDALFAKPEGIPFQDFQKQQGEEPPVPVPTTSLGTKPPEGSHPKTSATAPATAPATKSNPAATPSAADPPKPAPAPENSSPPKPPAPGSSTPPKQ